MKCNTLTCLLIKQAYQGVANEKKHTNNSLEEKMLRINSNHQAPSNPAVNMLASSLGLLDIIKYLGDFGQIHSKNKRFGLWTHSMEIETQDCSLNPSCKFCSQLVNSEKNH